jgi:hypothetical protein
MTVPSFPFPELSLTADGPDQLASSRCRSSTKLSRDTDPPSPPPVPLLVEVLLVVELVPLVEVPLAVELVPLVEVLLAVELVPLVEVPLAVELVPLVDALLAVELPPVVAELPLEFVEVPPAPLPPDPDEPPGTMPKISLHAAKSVAAATATAITVQEGIRRREGRTGLIVLRPGHPTLSMRRQQPSQAVRERDGRVSAGASSPAARRGARARRGSAA